MCGRYSNMRTDDELRRAFGVQSIAGPELEPSWNVAPTNDVRIVLDRAEQDSGTTTLREMRTGGLYRQTTWMACENQELYRRLDCFRLP